MPFKFEKLEVWQLALDYVDLMYQIAEKLPKNEDFNLKSQLTRAATSISLNIAEGSTGQSDAEQSRFLGMAIRSLIETVACQRLILRRKFLSIDNQLTEKADSSAQTLARKLHSFRRSLRSSDSQKIGEHQAQYLIEDEDSLS
jgi:four helix bundle protein